MKKTIKISLQGTIFHVDEDAYILLKQYLTEIGDYFKSRDEADEILQDIEIRIAEIFTERLEGNREVVTLKDVEYMISQMGKPADIFGEDEHQGYTAPPYTYGRKRLYRDPENAVLGGVCGGLGAYFDVDPVWFRVSFVLLLLGYGVAFLIYILLWIILPEARSATQRLEMRGEQVNVDNIGRTVNREFQKVKENLKNVPNSPAYHHTRSALQDFFHIIGSLLLSILKIIAVIIGIILVITGVTTLVALTGMLFFSHSWFLPDLFLYSSFYLPDLLSLVTSPENVPYIIAGLVLTIGIPLLTMVYGGIKIIFRIRANDRVVGITFFVLWLISAISLSFFIMDIASGNAEGAKLTENVPLKSVNADTLFLDVASYPGERIKEMISIDNTGIYRDEVTGELLGRPEVSLLHSTGEVPELEIFRRARGKSREVAISHAESIRYNWDTLANRVVIDPWFRSGESWFRQKVEFRFRIPEGMVVCLHKDLRKILHYAMHEERTSTYNMAGKCWVMTEKGLKHTE